MKIEFRLHSDMQRPKDGLVRIVLGKITSEIPCRVSSDLHEWHNDMVTVSTKDSVKLQDE